MPELYRGVEYVRVKDKASRDEYTIEKRLLKDGIVDADGLTVLKKDALGPNGKLAPPKLHTALGTPAPGRRTKTSGAKASGKEAGQTSADTEQEK